MSKSRQQDETDLWTIEKVVTVFSQLSAGNWQSFVANKMGVLKLPDDLLEAVRRGELEYTKTTALRKVKDEGNQRGFMEVAKETSLEQLREMIREQSESTPSQTSVSTKSLSAVARKQLDKLPAKDQRRALKLLQELETLRQR